MIFLFVAFVAGQTCGPGLKLLTLAGTSAWSVADRIGLDMANASMRDWTLPTYDEGPAWTKNVGFFGPNDNIPRRNVSNNVFYARFSFDLETVIPDVLRSCVRRVFLHPYVQGGTLLIDLNGKGAVTLERSIFDAILGNLRLTLTKEFNWLNEATAMMKNGTNVLTMEFRPADDTRDTGDWLFDVTSEIELGFTVAVYNPPDVVTFPTLEIVALVVGIIALLLVVGGAYRMMNKRRETWGEESKKFTTFE